MSADRRLHKTVRRRVVWSGNSDTSLKLQLKSFAVDILHAGSVEAFGGAAFDEFDDQVVDAVHAFETVKTVCAARYDDMKTVRQSLRNAITVRWRRHWIPLACQNQNR